MKWAEQLSQALKRNEEKEEQKKQIREVMLAAISDSVITTDELKQIVELCNSSNLTSDEIYFLRLEAFQSAVRKAIEDRRVSEEEETSLHHIHSVLQLSEDVFDEAETKISMYRNLYEIEQGNLVRFSVGIDLHPLENCYWIADVVLMEEKNIGVDSSSGTKIAKGLTYRIGSSKGQLVAETDLAPIAKGVLYVTNQRMIFSGEGKSFDIAYANLVDIGLYNDGMRFLVNENEKPYLFKTQHSEDIEAIGLLLSDAANGLL
jgi:hypothetical protein